MKNYFRNHGMFLQILENCTDKDFIEETGTKYHYPKEQWQELRKVAEQMKRSMLEQAAFTHYIAEEGTCHTEAVMTLGKGVDELQESYTGKGDLSKSYMVEILGSEILLYSYQAYNQWVSENTSFHVAKFDFPEGREIPDLLKNADSGVICNSGYCMIPRKSVAFRAVLTMDDSVRCGGLCEGCDSRSCPNRVSVQGGIDGTDTDKKSIARMVMYNLATDMTDRPLPYGYARILGGLL